MKAAEKTLYLPGHRSGPVLEGFASRRRKNRRWLVLVVTLASLVLTFGVLSCLVCDCRCHHYHGQDDETTWPLSHTGCGRSKAKIFRRYNLIRHAQDQHLADDGSDAGVPVPGVARPPDLELASARKVLECFQVHQPVPSTPTGMPNPEVSDGGSPCTVTLMEHKFGNSYGQPFVGNYTPPPCSFNRVTLNFTAVSVGRQFDRLALMYLGDVEVWRTSTAEPTIPPGIKWEFRKDVTEFLSLWRQQQTLVFDLGNIVNDVYTGWFNTTLKATFFTIADGGTHPYVKSDPADLILPITKMTGRDGIDSRFTIPEDRALVTLPLGAFPRNAAKAVFSISANGEAEEEFWWSDVMESSKHVFEGELGSILPGLSPWREVQLLIDGHLTGVYWPFPVIFTGGISPGLHRPIVGIDAFELREHEIDITPWLGVLCDGRQHTFEMRIAGIDDSGTGVVVTEQVASSWVVTGKIFIWLDGDAEAVTMGPKPALHALDPVIRITQHRSEDQLAYQLTVEREIIVQSFITTHPNNSGEDTQLATWSQSLAYRNNGLLTNRGYGQINTMKITGLEHAKAGHPSNTKPYYHTAYAFPLHVNSTYEISPTDSSLTIHAALTQGLSHSIYGTWVHPQGMEVFSGSPYKHQVPGDKILPHNDSGYEGIYVATKRSGRAYFHQTGDGKKSSGFGSARQVFDFGTHVKGRDDDENEGKLRLYSRDVEAVNGTVVRDIVFEAEEAGVPNFTTR